MILVKAQRHLSPGPHAILFRMRLYLIRHGETDANRILGNGVTGHMHDEPVTFKEGDSTDVPLNVYGRTQAEEAGESLPDHIDAIYSSPLHRARETAKIIAGVKGIDVSEIISRVELAEYSIGSLEGLSQDKKREAAGGKVWGSGLMCTYDYTKWGGDSWKTIHDRTDSFFRELKGKNGDDRIVVCVTSAGIIRMAYKLLLSDKAPDINQHVKIENGSVHKFII